MASGQEILQAGLSAMQEHGIGLGILPGKNIGHAVEDIIAAVAPLIAAAEREACAKVADATAGMEAYRTGRQYEDPAYLAGCDAKEDVALDIAAAIRARSDAP